jgi:hypothetical protein
MFGAVSSPATAALPISRAVSVRRGSKNLKVLRGKSPLRFGDKFDLRPSCAAMGLYRNFNVLMERGQKFEQALQ